MKCDDWMASTIIKQSDFQVQHLRIESDHWTGALDILSCQFARAFPTQTWEPGPELANETTPVPPELFDSALRNNSGGRDSPMRSGFIDKLIERIRRVQPEEVQNYLVRLASEKGFLERIFDALQEGVIVTDIQGKIQFINAAAAQLLGRSQRRRSDAHWRKNFPVLIGCHFDRTKPPSVEILRSSIRSTDSSISMSRRFICTRTLRTPTQCARTWWGTQ